jgi:hypothetical protein
MRIWLRPCLATVVLLVTLSGGAVPVSGAVTRSAVGSDLSAGTGSELATRSDVRPGPLASAFAPVRPEVGFLSDAPLDAPAGPFALSFGRRGPHEPNRTLPSRALGPERARILLRSLTLPGWGQATLGRRTSAVFFGLTETAIWGTFAAFRIQVAMREDTFLRTAGLQAGIDLGGRDEEWRRIVGNFASSDEYNQLVVLRDAANLYYFEPEAYWAYYEEHKLKGADTWMWSGDGRLRYLDQRRKAQRAAQRANTALAVAVMNRIVSALHAARAAGHSSPAARSWQFEVVPVACEDATAFQLRVHARF